jgi:hypothetical protein
LNHFARTLAGGTVQSSLRRPQHANRIDDRPSLSERAAAVAARLWHSGWWTPLLLTLPALAPLLRPGFYVSDDGLFHVYRIAALADAWQHGVLYPRLFPEFGFGYGQAVFNFYAPLSYVPGALLSMLGVSPDASAEWTVALGFVLAALAAYGMGKYLWGRGGGLLAAVVYTYFPYHLADAYLRGALPEHMAFVFPPLIVWTTVAAFREPNPVPSYLWSALAWTGLAYTHNLTLLLVAPMWLVFALLLALKSGRSNRFWGIAGGAVLGAGLSAALWLPFLAESNLVGIGLGVSDGYKDHLAPLRELVQLRPVYHYRASHGAGAAEHPLGWPGVGFAALAAAHLIVTPLRRQRIPDAGLAWFGLALFAVASLLTTAPALPIWRLAQPLLAQLQYPWRFMTLAALGLSLATGVLAVNPFRIQRNGTTRDEQAASSRLAHLWGGLILALALVYMAYGLARVPTAPVSLTSAEAWGTARMWADDAAAGQVGATWTGEFLPQTVREQRWALGRPLEGARDGPPLEPAPAVTLKSVGYDRMTLAFDRNPPPQVRLHQFHLPAWWASLDGERVPTYPSGELGLVTVDVPAGTKEVAFRFGPTRAAVASAVIVLVSALAWAMLAWSHRWNARRRDRFRLTLAAPLLLVLVAALILNGWGVGKAQQTPAAVGSDVGDVARLLAYDAQPARGERGLDVTLYWFALRETAQNYKAFVHLLSPDGRVLAQADGDPVGGFTPTSRWKPGEVIPDTYRLRLAAEIPPGEYELRAGMYEVRPNEDPGFRNLDVTPAAEDNRVRLGTVTVSSPN